MYSLPWTKTIDRFLFQENSYRICSSIVGKCSSQLQIVSSPGHEQNHHNAFSGLHHRFFALKI
jgi:hypothetical protein